MNDKKKFDEGVKEAKGKFALLDHTFAVSSSDRKEGEDSERINGVIYGDMNIIHEDLIHVMENNKQAATLLQNVVADFRTNNRAEKTTGGSDGETTMEFKDHTFAVTVGDPGPDSIPDGVDLSEKNVNESTVFLKGDTDKITRAIAATMRNNSRFRNIVFNSVKEFAVGQFDTMDIKKKAG